jgi:hypothetical protein
MKLLREFVTTSSSDYQTCGFVREWGPQNRLQNGKQLPHKVVDGQRAVHREDN